MLRLGSGVAFRVHVQGQADAPVGTALALEDASTGHRFLLGPLPVRIHQPGGEPLEDIADLEGGEYALQAFDGQRMLVDPELTVLRRVRPEPAADVDLNGVVDGCAYLDALFRSGVPAPDPAFNDQFDVDDDGALGPSDAQLIREAFGAGW